MHRFLRADTLEQQELEKLNARVDFQNRCEHMRTRLQHKMQGAAETMCALLAPDSFVGVCMVIHDVHQL